MAEQETRATRIETDLWNEMRKDMLGARIQHDPTLQLLVKAVSATMDKELSQMERSVDTAFAEYNRILADMGKTIERLSK